MKCEHIQEKITGYLDKELTQQDSQQVSVHMAGCDSCRKTHDEMLMMKEQLGKLSYPKSDLQVLEELENDVLAKRSAGLGWFLVILSFAIVVGTAVTEFFTSDSASWKEKLLIMIGVGGPLALLGTVVRQRVMMYRNDRYRKVKL